MLWFLPRITGNQTSGSDKYANGMFCFLDVGQGNCTVIICDEEAMIIDGRLTNASQLAYELRIIIVLKEVGVSGT